MLVLEALREQQQKRVAFMIGRLNPPTLGHYKVIDKMKKFIRENPDLKLESTPVIVIIEGKKSSEDKSKNPLTAEERIEFMKASGRANGVIFLIGNNAFTATGKIRDEGYEPIAIGAGSDRAKTYKENLDKFFKTPDGEDIEHFIIPDLDRVVDAVLTKKTEKTKAMDSSLDKLKEKELSDDEISGSLARRAVELGFKEEFAKIVGLENKPDLAKKMFNKIKKSMGI